jgi:hypothetical protein
MGVEELLCVAEEERMVLLEISEERAISLERGASLE